MDFRWFILKYIKVLFHQQNIAVTHEIKINKKNHNKSYEFFCDPVDTIFESFSARPEEAGA